MSNLRTRHGKVESPVTAARVREMQAIIKRDWGWSARRLSEYLSIDRSTLKRIESGKRNPSAGFIVAFRKLEREYQWWLKDQGQSTGIVIIADFDVPDRIELFTNGRWKRAE